MGLDLFRRFSLDSFTQPVVKSAIDAYDKGKLKVGGGQGCVIFYRREDPRMTISIMTSPATYPLIGGEIPTSAYVETPDSWHSQDPEGRIYNRRDGKPLPHRKVQKTLNATLQKIDSLPSLTS